MKVLVIEDGYEHSETLGRFLPDITWVRAGSGPKAIDLLRAGGFDAVFLDMRFDRVPDEELLGDVAETADRFNGDPAQARLFLQDHQGTYVLAALRAAGFTLPVVLSYDFDAEPRRWSHLAARYAPVAYLPDGSGPRELALLLTAPRPS